MFPMEDCLHLPLKFVLPIMQYRIANLSTYFGIRTLKSPTDFWVYQELLYETRPDFVVEIGNFRGGSALALAHMCDSLGKGRVIGVDISHATIADTVRQHPRITLIEGDAFTSLPRVQALIGDVSDVLVIEDSSHTFENTVALLEAYSPLIRPGGYFIVEDGIINHGLYGTPYPGPYEAIHTFIERHADFEIDRSRESFLITWNLKGYLRRTRG